MSKVGSTPALLAINNYFYRRGGAEVIFLEQNRLFEEMGWRVVPFSMRHPKNIPSLWSSWFVDEIELEQQYPTIRKALNATKVIYSVEARHRIGELIGLVRPDIAHAHNVYHHISPAIFGTLKASSIPTVLTLHDLKIACPAYRMLAHDGVCERCKSGQIWNVAMHRCMKGSLPLSLLIGVETLVHRLLGCYSKNVDRFVVPSRFYLEKFVEWGWRREQFVYIPNFVDIERLRPAGGSPGKTFVFVGRLSSEKGVKTLVRALALAEVQGVFVGAGPEEKELRRLADEVGASVTFAGYRAGQALVDAIRDARAVVLPSEWYENAPVSLMEAYALERPVIGAAIGGIPELIRDGVTGALFPSGDVEALAAKLRNFADTPDDDIAAMGKAGRSWVENEFTGARYRERLIEMYRTMGVKC